MATLPHLAIQPQQPADPLEQYSKLISVQHLATQGEIQKQQIKAGELENQARQIQVAQAQRDQQDQEAGNKAYVDSGGDPQKFQDLIRQYGGSFKLATNVTQILAKQRAELANADEASFKAKKEANTILGQRTQEILDAPPEDQPALYALKLNQIKRDPVLSKYAADLPPQFPGPEALKHTAIGLGMSKALMDEADEARKAKKAPFEQSTVESDATIKGAQAAAVKQGGVVPGVPIENQEANAWLAAHPGKTLVDYQKYAKTLVPAFNFNLQAGGVGGGPVAPKTDANGQPLSYEDQIKSFGAKGGTVKAVIEGRQTMPGGFALKSPYWQDVMNKVYQVDPQFNEQRAQLRKAYTVGQPSKEINAINTAMGHVGVLGDAIDALNNGNVRILNSIANRIGVEIGKTPVATMKTIVHRVGPELSKAYIGAGGSAGERGADEKDFDENLAPSVLKNNVGITAQLLRSKIGSLENQWDQNKAPSMKSFQDQFISPEAKKQLDKWNPQQAGGEGVVVKDPRGVSHTFPDQKSADDFKAAAGIK